MIFYIVGGDKGVMDYATRYLGKIVEVTMDRSLGSKHPKHGFEYLVNYGYIAGTTAPDGGGVDAYVLGVDIPLEKFSGRCIAVIHRTNDEDDKLVVVPDGIEIVDEEIIEKVEFQEKFFESVIVRKKE